jgi:hypothetical protein
MEEAWNAAKEENKETVYIEFSELVEDWTVRDYQGAALEDGFTYKEQAEAWAIENGYRLK